MVANTFFNIKKTRLKTDFVLYLALKEKSEKKFVFKVGA